MDWSHGLFCLFCLFCLFVYCLQNHWDGRRPWFVLFVLFVCLLFTEPLGWTEAMVCFVCFFLFIILLENISSIKWRHYCQWRPAKLGPMLNANAFGAGDLDMMDLSHCLFCLFVYCLQNWYDGLNPWFVLVLFVCLFTVCRTTGMDRGHGLFCLFVCLLLTEPLGMLRPAKLGPMLNVYAFGAGDLYRVKGPRFTQSHLTNRPFSRASLMRS